MSQNGDDGRMGLQDMLDASRDTPTDGRCPRSYDGGDFTVMVVGGPNSRNGAPSSRPLAASFSSS